MRRVTLPRPSAPIVINLIALSIVLGGHAIASPGKGSVGRGDIAPGAVTSRNLTPSAVTGQGLRRAVVTEDALRKRSVRGRAIKPGSVTGLALTGVIPPGVKVPDADPPGPMGADSNWTSSGAVSSCPAGAQLLGGGLAIQQLGNSRAFIQSTAPSNTDPATWVGQISTDTGGTSPGAVVAVCLK